MKLNKIIIPTLLCGLALVGCNNKNTTTPAGTSALADIFQNTESTFTGYTSNYKITGEADTVVYEEDNTFAIERGTTINTRFSSTLRELNDNISVAYPNLYNTESYSYVTIGTTMYLVATTGISSETAYSIPSKFLSFTYSDDYITDLADSTENSVITYTGKIKDESISAFFGDESLKNVGQFVFTVKVSDNHLTSFDFTYVDSGDSISLNVEGSYSFSYDAVTITHSAN